MAEEGSVQKIFLWALIIGIFVLSFLLLKPIMISIIFGLLFAYVFIPVYKAINKKIKYKNVSAFLLILGIIIIIAIPAVYFTPSLVKQTFDTYVLLQNFNFAEVFSKFSFIEADLAQSLAIHLDNLLGKVFSSFLNQFTDLLVNLPSVLLQFAVFLFTFFFAVRDSEKLKDYVSKLSPFSKSTNDKFMKEFRGITNAIIFGQVLIGIVQGLAVGAGLFFLGVPKALTLTFVACLVSIIPVLGSWIIWLPVGAFLLIIGQTFSGIFLLLYGALFVSTIDNLLRPYILSKQSRLPIALSVIGTIGGLYLFGIAGLILGPMILAYALIILEFYQNGKFNELFRK